MNYKLLAKQFAYYSKVHLDRSELDELYIRNILLHKFHEFEDGNDAIDYKIIDNLSTPDYLINELYTLNGSENIQLANEIMGIISPSPSEVITKFYKLKENSSLEALNYLYDLQIKNNYIKKTAIDKNIKWLQKFDNNHLEITINLSKPEKNNKDIAKALTQNEEKYPKCLLCLENLGYGGNPNHPARQNIRIIPFRLNNEDFFMQYSPYCYYDHHCIVISNKHIPMEITRNTFIHLLDFVDLFEDYFLGSNSDLPIVGGSILTHQHYQGGLHKLPIMYSSTRYTFLSKNKDIKIEYLDWYNSCIKLSSKNKEALVNALETIRTQWIDYNNPMLNIISYTNNIKHNTITPIVKKEKNYYNAYIILRNNNTSDEYPEGIFHAHQEYHNIKREGIGLIEAMGLFILPGRLVSELKEIKNILINNIYIDENYLEMNPHIAKHINFILELKNHYNIDKDNIDDIVKIKISEICMHILENTAVFKNDKMGNEAAINFIKSLNL